MQCKVGYAAEAKCSADQTRYEVLFFLGLGRVHKQRGDKGRSATTSAITLFRLEQKAKTTITKVVKEPQGGE